MALKLSTGMRNKMLRAGGNSAVDCYADGYIEIRDGSQPATADAAETGNLLARITLNAGDYTNLVANGISPTCVGTALTKPGGETWKGIGLLAGVAGWWRWYDTAGTHGASTSAVRMDGAISQAGGQLRMGSTDIKVGTEVTIDSVNINFPTA